MAPKAFKKSSIIFGIVKGHDVAWAQQKTPVICAYFAFNGIFNGGGNLVEAHDIAQHFQIMHHLRFARIRLFEREIVVGFGTDIVVALHVVVDALNDVVARRTQRKQFASVVAGIIQRPYSR